MPFQSASHLSIYKNLPAERMQKRDAMDALWFFAAVQCHLQVDDVESGPNPPDFLLKSEGRRIGIELTHSFPTTSSQGFLKMADYKKWREANEQKASHEKIEFNWGKYSLGETISTFSSQLIRKCEAAEQYKNSFDELWLVFSTETASPMTKFMIGTWVPKPGYEQPTQDFRAKFFYEMNKVCMAAQPFNHVIFFYGPNILAFSVGENRYKFPVPNDGLVKHGAGVPDSFLDWKDNMTSFSERMKIDVGNEATAVKQLTEG